MTSDDSGRINYKQMSSDSMTTAKCTGWGIRIYISIENLQTLFIIESKFINTILNFTFCRILYCFFWL